MPEMGELWTEAYKLKTSASRGRLPLPAELGYIPASAVAEIKAKANLTPRVLEIEAEVRHDMIVLTNVNE